MPRTRRRRGYTVRVAAGVTLALVAVNLAAVPPSTADVPAPYFATTNLASDPHIIQCTDPVTNTAGFCLYTSQDMGQKYAYPPANHYPMRDTRAYFSADGVSNWVDKGVVATEAQFDAWIPRNRACTDADPPSNNKPFSPETANKCRPYHFWAPSAVKSGDLYYLFVPDVSDTDDTGTPNIHTSSRIGVFAASGPFGTFSYQGTVDHSSGYMSDPDVIIDGSNRYLLWADGDNSNCGGFKSAKLGTNFRTINSGTTQTLTINGLNVLGNCGGKGRPYVEGASIYKRSFKPGTSWTIFFAAKPTSVPTACSSSYTPSDTANTDHEVIAWASATSAQGPYTYEGIVMCGSTTEWTNQATVAKAGPGLRTMMVYHDSPAGKTRRLHAECLFVNSAAGRIGGVYRQKLDAGNGFNDCMNGTNASYYGWHLYDPQYPGNPPIVSAPSSGTALQANRYAVGPWERYRHISLGSGAFAIKALSNGKYLCTTSSSTAVTASCNNQNDPGAVWRMDVSGTPGNGTYLLYNNTVGKYLSVAANAKLYASGTDTANAAVLTQLYPGGA